MSTERRPLSTARRPVRVLVTGAGGPAGVSVLRALAGDPMVHLLAADMDGFAAGLYLLPPADRRLVPAGDAEDFVPRTLELCRQAGVDVVIPTVDAELLPLARARSAFAAAGIRLALTGAAALASTLDKWALVQRCAGAVATPRTALLDADLAADSWTYPVLVKPRSGSGSRGIRIAAAAADLRRMGTDQRLIVQEFLPGEEYSLDVLADAAGRVVSVVPRARLRVDSGVSVAGRTLHDPELDALARGVFAAVGLSLVANVQCRRDAAGRAVLLEVNPRFPGALPLTVGSGVDMPRLCLDAVLGRPLPAAVPHTDQIMVRFLAERFVDPAELLVADGPAQEARAQEARAEETRTGEARAEAPRAEAPAQEARA